MTQYTQGISDLYRETGRALSIKTLTNYCKSGLLDCVLGSNGRYLLPVGQGAAALRLASCIRKREMTRILAERAQRKRTQSERDEWKRVRAWFRSRV